MVRIWMTLDIGIISVGFKQWNDPENTCSCLASTRRTCAEKNQSPPWDNFSKSLQGFAPALFWGVLKWIAISTQTFLAMIMSLQSKWQFFFVSRVWLSMCKFGKGTHLSWSRVCDENISHFEGFAATHRLWSGLKLRVLALLNNELFPVDLKFSTTNEEKTHVFFGII